MIEIYGGSKNTISRHLFSCMREESFRRMLRPNFNSEQPLLVNMIILIIQLSHREGKRIKKNQFQKINRKRNRISL